jgi:ABC-type enterochelin transport system permease subunit
VTFTATVSSGSGTPTGTVTFYNNTANMGTATLSGGQAIFNKIFVSAGAKLITAVYSGDATFASSTSPELNQVVDQATTTTTLVSSVNPSVVGQLVTFTATVTPQFGGSPTGTVTFMNGTATMGTVTISGGQAKFNKKFVIQGMKSITANYSGDPNFTASSGGLIQTVN